MIRAFQWDLARQVERLEVLKKLLPRYAAWGYQELYLHLEDAVHYPSLPGIGRDDAYRYEELGELVLAAAQAGIRVVPIVNLLGHTQYLVKHPDYRDLNELRDERGHPRPTGQVCPLHPGTLEVAERLIADVAPYCTAGLVHVGLDESFHLGKCPRCREEVAAEGLAAHFAGHVQRLHRVAAGRGLQLGLWADMFNFVPDAIALLPRGLTVYDWYYYPFTRSPRVEFHNFAERDLLPALRRQGARYYGCPMNGAFRHEPLPVFGDRLANIRSWWQRCQKTGAEGFLVTSWEAYRLALETTTVVDAAAAGLWLNPGHDDATTLLAGGLERVFPGRATREQARTLLAADAHAFAGYARWQINDRWDVCAGQEPLAGYEQELRFFLRTRENRHPWPAAFAHSLDFRLYLARRDVFVRQAARTVFKARRLLRRAERAGALALVHALQADAERFRGFLRAGVRAARGMWRRTRDPRQTGQNEILLRGDAERLRAWRRFLAGARRRLERLAGPTPVCGAWQLQFVVHNHAPAVARVVVEERQADGSWRELAGRHTIEFRASAARPRTRVRREFNVPVTSPDAALRVLVRGVGEVGLSHMTLTDGVTALTDARFRPMKKMGRRTPAHGMPDPTASGPAVELRFGR